MKAVGTFDAPIGYLIQIGNALAAGLVLYILSRLPKFRLRPAN